MAAEYPENLRYTKDHEWARVDGTRAVVGITAFARDQLGDVVYLELPEEGTAVKAGEPFGVVESTKAVSELFSPVTGKVARVNKELVDAPERINEDPYEKSWMIEIEMASGDDANALLTAAQYKEFVDSEGR